MENKRKNTQAIIIILLVVLLLVVIGILIWQTIKYNKYINSIHDNQINIDKEKTEIESKEYTLSELISETKNKQVQEDNFKFTSIMPQIKLQKENADKINNKIKEYYNGVYEGFKAKPTNVEITYDAKVEGSILIITINDSYSGWVGTGEPEGTTIIVYKYDYLNDKQVYTEVSDLVEDMKHYDNPIINYLDEESYELDMVLPRLIIQTKETEKINNEIDKIYHEYIDEYFSDEITKLNSRNTTISYIADMNKEEGIITLKITIKYTDWAGTGDPEGSMTKEYKYDYINDKAID